MSRTLSALDKWIEKNPFLDELANLYRPISQALAEIDKQQKAGEIVEDWDLLVQELKKGIPALKATSLSNATVDMVTAEIVRLATALAGADIPEQLQAETVKIQALSQDKLDSIKEALVGLLAQDEKYLARLEADDINPGVFLFLAWNVLAKVLMPLKLQVEKSLVSDIHWKKEYCPVCGQLPAMAQLVRTQKGRERDLICGCCASRWRYQRMACPSCLNEEQESLNLIEAEEIDHIRIDTCDKCKGYLKTYTEEGDEEVILADWTTIHLDVIARDAGFKRYGFQLYNL